MAKIQNVIGLFGTAGNSQWRAPVIERLEQEDISYFNPSVEEWTPDCAPIEAEHLATDKVVLFVVTCESESFGSLAETGWAILSAMENGRSIIFVIQDYPGENTLTPNRVRTLVRAHARRADVRIYDSIDKAVEVAITAFRS